MRELPLLLSGPMVRAILDGRKTQTRRPARQQYGPSWKPIKMFEDWSDNTWGVEAGGMSQIIESPFGAPGDLLWVRETWLEFELYHRPPRFAYRADITDSEQEQIRKEYGYKWRPSVHMPRWASRLTLRVLRVWAERVQDISESDARAEGIEARHYNFSLANQSNPRMVFPELDGGFRRARDAFEALWDSIYAGKGLGWNSNPLVWACEFEVVREQA